MNMKKYTLTFLLTSVFLVGLFSQNYNNIKKAHLFTVSTGYSYHIVKDDVVSPSIYSGSKIPIRVNYFYQGFKNRQTFSFFFNRVKLKSDIPDLPNNLSHYTDNVYSSLDYSYNKRIYNLSIYQVQCFLGGKYKSFLNYRVHYFLENQAEFTFEQINSIGLNLLIEKRFFCSEDFIQFSMHTPFIAYSIYNNIYSEKAYMNQIININNSNIDMWKILKGGKLVTINKFFEFQIELSYTKFITKRIGLNVNYGLDYYSFAQYKQILHATYLNTQLLIGAIIKI